MKVILPVLVLFAFCFSCQPSQPETPKVVIQEPSPIISGKFVHMVFFWLKPEADMDAFLTNTRDLMEKVEVVKKYHIGTPAMTPRDVVDNTYSVCLVVTFDSKEDHEIYQTDSVHNVYRNAIKDDIDKLQIYDSFSE